MARMMSTSVLLRRKSKRQQHRKLFILLTILLLGLGGLPTTVTVVNAVWYSEICHTGPRYKVRIDETTGKVVPVAPFQTTTGGSGSGSGFDSNGGIFYDTNNVMPETIKINNTISNSTTDDYVSVGDNNSNRRVLRSRQIWRDFGDGTDDDNNDEESSYDALVVQSSRSRSVGVLGEIITEEVEPDPTVSAEFAKRFLLQSQQEEQEEHEEFDDDSSLLRRFLQQMQPTQMSPQQQLEQDIEELLDNDGLLEGEFFVKPCLCPGSRWTFPTTTTTIGEGEGEGGYDPSAAAAADGNNSTTELADGDDETNTNTPSSTFIKGPHSRNSNPGYNNYGQHTNGNYYYVPDNLENGDLYLCQVSAMYCGVPMDSSTGNDIVVKCYAQNMRHIIARNAWPLILLWYFGLAMICCCTVHGRTAGDYVQDRFTYYITKYIFCCCFNSFSSTNSRSNSNHNNNEQEQEHEQEHYEYDFNSRMLNRMIDDQEQEYGRRPTPSPDNDDDDDEQQSPTTRQQRRPWYYTSRRRNFERSLLSQVQWIWRHQEYLHEIQRRTDGLPPPQLKLKTKRFCMTTTTSGSRGIGFGTSIPIPIPTTLEDTVDIPNANTNTNDDTTTTTTTFNNTTNDTTATSTMTTTESSATASATITATTINKNNEDDNCDDTTTPNEDGDDDDDDNEQQEFVTLDLGIKAQDGDDPQDDDSDDDDDEMDRTNKSCSHHDGDDDDDDDQAENDDDDEEPTCTICFCPFEEGDKIGDLICRHEFHVECLKGWAQRKNACPLCNVRLGRPERPSPITNASTRTSLQSPTIQSSLSLSLASSLSTSLALSSLREQTSRTTTANNNNNNDSNNIDSTSSTPSSTTTTTGGGGGGGLMQRISGLGRRNGSNNNNNNSNNNNGNTSNTGTGTGTGEIQMSNRVGIIASFSAADDTNTAYSNRR